jgi:Nuclease-related domain
MSMSFLVSLLLAMLGGYLLGRSRASSLQNYGEALVCRELQANFSGPDHHLLNHITLKLKDGTTQIDHILVSRFGMFVIETKDYKGWIFANAKHATWTQVLYRWKFKFQNPIFQNMRHVRAVQELLDFLPPEAIKSVDVFTGRAEFKTDMPSGVYTLPGLIDHLRAATEEVMSLNRVQFCVGRLETARLAISGQTDLEHVKSLQRKHGGPN